MRYSIYEESQNYYYLIHRRNNYCMGVKKKISKRKFLYWRQGKINDTDYSKVNKISPTKQTKVPDKIEITAQEKEVISMLSKMLQDENYILESSIILDGHSKAFTSRTVRSEKKLNHHGLERVRTTKEIKEKLGIKSKGYPYILIRKTN